MSGTRAVAERFAALFAAGDALAALGMLNDDGVFTIIGNTPLSGSYHGRDDLMSRLLPALAGFKSPLVIRFDDIVVDGDRAVFIGSGGGEGPHARYDQPHYCLVTRVAGDGFSEVVEFMDTMMIEKAVFGRSLA